MRSKTLHELNIMIALYMGAKEVNPSSPQSYSMPGKSGVWYGFDYNTSWTDLMPVIEKISKIKYDDGDSVYPRTFGMMSGGEYMFRFNRYPLYQSKKLIDAAFYAVIGYLKNNPNP